MLSGIAALVVDTLGSRELTWLMIMRTRRIQMMMVGKLDTMRRMNNGLKKAMTTRPTMMARTLTTTLATMAKKNLGLTMMRSTALHRWPPHMMPLSPPTRTLVVASKNAK